MAEEVGVAFVRLVPSMQGFGRAAAGAMTDELNRPAQQAGDEAGQQAGGKFAGAFKAGLAGAALGAGMALVAGIGEALDQGKITAKLGAQLGKTPEEAKRYGEIAGDLYSNAVTEDFQGAADAIKATMSAGLLPPEATNRQIESISTKVADLANTFDQDLGSVTNAVSQMLKTGLAKNAGEAFDLLTVGFQSSANKADDFLDTINEYGTQFRKAGLDGATAIGLMNQAIEAGARDSDIAADAIKEFSIRAVDGSKTTADGFKLLGLSADDMAAKFGKGGKSATAALDETLDRLRNIEDPVKRSEAAVALFGTQAEDLGDALFAMDPSEAVKGLGDVGGAAEEMGNTLRDNAGTKVEQFKRKLTQGLVEFLGGEVIPAITSLTTTVKDEFGAMWAEAGKGSEDTADQAANFVKLLGQKIGEKIVEMAPEAIESLLEFGQAVADYVIANPGKVLKIALIAGALVMAIAKLPLLVAAALATAASAMIVGFVGTLIGALFENLPKWWGSFKGWVAKKAGQAGGMFASVGLAIGRWFGGLWSKYIAEPVRGAWDSFISTVRGLPRRAVNALGRLGGSLAGAASSAWQSFRDAAGEKLTKFLNWAEGTPGRIGRAVGSLRWILWDKGIDVVKGLWSGINAMKDWLKSKVSNFITDTIPNKVGSLLGISSPSKVMANEVGRWIPAGIAKGWQSGMNRLSAMADSTVAAVMPALPAGAGASRASASAPPTIIIDGVNQPGPLLEWLRNSIRTEGSGDVQGYLGQPRR